MNKRITAVLLPIVNTVGLGVYALSPFFWMCRTDKWLPIAAVVGALLLATLLATALYHLYLLVSSAIQPWLSIGLLLFDSMTMVGVLLATAGILVGGDTYLLFALDSCSRTY
jgi:hypothetical protein